MFNEIDKYPLFKVYGRFAGALLVVPAVMGELFWSASILAALGTTLAVILNLPVTPTIIVSAAVAVFYTLFGGIYAVAYTDVIQDRVEHILDAVFYWATLTKFYGKV